MTATATGTVVDGRFEFLARLDDQGLGDTWKARDTVTRNRQVAVKFLRALDPGVTALPEPLTQQMHLKRAKPLRHGNVLATVHRGLWGGSLPYVVHDLFEGPSLGTGLDVVRALGTPLPLEMMERFFDRIVSSVEAAHAAKVPVVHGGLHPGCVLIQRLSAHAFDVRVIDSGLAPYGDVTPTVDPGSART